jgi:hypothetical protein
MWIDDVTVYETVDECRWPAHVEDFPVLVADREGRIWMATLERPVPRRSIGVYRVEDTKRRLVCRLEPDNATGIGPPALAGFANGCVVAFAVEWDGRWQIAYAFIEEDSPALPVCRFLDCEGTSNISPAVAATGDHAWILWESNAGHARGIYACRVDRNRAGRVKRISRSKSNSYNPTIVALENGSFFAAWDSVRDRSADVYGAWLRGGRWRAERRLTSDARIERHPALAVRGNEVWMAWQAQSYRNLRLNNLDEQRIAVARVDGDRLRAPKDLFDEVSTGDELLMRPQIAFDRRGRLWLTARQSNGRQAGWLPIVWCYDGREWSSPRLLMEQEGRWRGVALACGADGPLAAIQYDDLPDTWREHGIRPDWRSGALLKALAQDAKVAAGSLEAEPLQMPPTEFSLAERIELCSADLPRQSWRHKGRRLSLFWGDLHDHTDLSVCARATNPPGHDLFANERDIERVDFCALTDHGYNFDRPQWQFNGEQTRANHDPGRFVTFLGEEWTSDHISYDPPRYATERRTKKKVELRRYGHRNLIFRDPYHPAFYDSRDGDIAPEAIWKEFAAGDVIAIPHQLADLGNRPTDWTFHDARYQPVAEVFQTRGSYEYAGAPRQAGRSMNEPGRYLQDAWARGLIVGVIASPDHGGGDGKVGVWAEELTRDAIFRAILARHTFGTSGPKMALRFSAGDAMMGDVIKRPRGAIRFGIEALALRDVRELVIFRNNEIVFRATPDRKRVEIEWVDREPPRAERLWYYVRIHAADDHLAWSSPIWLLA